MQLSSTATFLASLRRTAASAGRLTRTLACVLAGVASSATAQGAAFTDGNIVVFQGAVATANNTTGAMVELNASAAGQSGVQTISINGTVADGTQLRFSGSANTTGYMGHSNDRTRVIVAGGNSTTTSSNSNTLNPRGVGVFVADGTYTVPSTWTGISGNQARSGTTLNNSLYYGVDQGGLYTNGATTPTPAGNLKGGKAFGGFVYIFQASNNTYPVSVLNGTTLTALPGLPMTVSGSPGGTLSDFYMIASGDNGVNYDVLYIAHFASATAGTIYKYSLVNGTWVANGTYATTFGGLGLAVKDSGNGADLFVSSGDGTTANNSVYKLRDDAGYNAAINITTANNVLLYTATGGATLKGVNFVPVATAANTELSTLTISQGTLSPAFASSTLSYSADVGTLVTSITVTPTAADAGSTIEVRANNGGWNTVASGAASGGLALVEGGNSIYVRVSNGGISKVYTLAVTRALGANTFLSSLALSSGTLSPAFAQATLSYNASVLNAVSSVTVTPTVADAASSVEVRVNGGAYQPTTSGAPSSALNLVEGNNTINVRVTGTDTTTKTYTITLFREPVVFDSTKLDVLEPHRGDWPAGGVTVNGTQFVNLGLQGVGRVAASTKDPVTGENLGSISDLQISNWVNNGNGTWSGTFHFLPDRGYNSGATYSNYAARVNVFNFTFTPYTSSTPTTAQDQLAMTFQGSQRFTYDHDNNASTPGKFTTGLLATGTAQLFGTTVPVAAGDSTQSDGTVTNRLTVDAEGLVFDVRPGKSGTGWVGDEYGAYIYHFNAQKQIDGQLRMPAALIPNSPVGTINYQADPPVNGRRVNQGMEGLAQSPDGKKLFGLLQSATIQDSGSGNQGRFNTRLLVYDVTASDVPSDPVAQYVIQLPRADDTGLSTNGASVNRNLAQSAILALNDHQILILSRDGNGRGVNAAAPVFKSILLADLKNATNIDGQYEAEGAAVAPGGVLNVAVTPITWKEALNMIGKLGGANAEVEKFGLNLNTPPGDINTISEKWEALGLVSVNDPAFPNDYFFFIGNDNDFLSSSGQLLNAAGALQSYDGGLENDTVVLAYRVRVVSEEDLNNLTISSGTLSPAFSNVTTTYTASVTNATSSVTVTPTATNGTSVVGVRVNSTGAFTTVASGSPSAALPLNVGTNLIEVQVTSAGGAVKVYSITITRASTQNLTGLTLSSGTLSPVFNAATLTYAASVGSGVGSVTVTPTLADAVNNTVQVRVNGGSYSPVTSGAASQPLALNAGSNTINVLVTGTDLSTRTYTITVLREPAVFDSTFLDVLEPHRGDWPAAGVNVGGTQFVNLGLQGVGRIPAATKDLATGENIGSVSDMQVTNWVKNSNGTYSGTFHFLPDRGYNSGEIYSNYAARINVFSFTFAPYTSSTPTTAQNQVAMTFTGSQRFTYDHDNNPSTPGKYTTGMMATGTANLFGTLLPVTAGNTTQSDGTVANRLTIDAEGLVFDVRQGKAGSGWIGDEYGAYIYHFNALKQIDGQLRMPAALIPHSPVGTNNHQADPPLNGRRVNQGIEGLAQSPDGRKLFGLLQSATIQDSGSGNQGRFNTRLLVYDVSSTDLPSDPVAQYVIQLPRADDTGSTTNGASVNRNLAQSSILALNDRQILILSRDGNGRGVNTAAPVFKSILLADLSVATNIDGTYDAEGAAVAPGGVLVPTVTPISWKEALNLIGRLGGAAAEVEKFGLNLNTPPGDLNTISEKWEALGLVPANDPAFPNDYFLFVGNDNDFLSASGKYMDANGALQNYNAGLENDTVVLAYRIRISTGTAYRFTSSTTTAQEDAGSITLSLQRDGSTTAAATVYVSTMDGSAKAGTDYFALSNVPVTFAAGSSTATVAVGLSNRPGLNADRTFTAVVSTPEFGTQGAVSTSVVTITEADAAFSLSTNALTIREDAGPATLTVVRTGGISRAASVRVSTVDGTAVAGTDYEGLNGFVVPFEIGDTEKTVSINLINRPGARPNRTFTVNLFSGGAGATIVSPASATLTITDADGLNGVLSFTRSTFTVYPTDPLKQPTVIPVVVQRTGNTAGAATATITASQPATVPVGQVKLDNVKDYTLTSNSATVSFADGEASKTVSLPLKSTARYGQVLLTLSAPSGGAVLGTPTQLLLQVEKRDTTAPTLNFTYTRPNREGLTTLSGLATDSPLNASGISSVAVSLSNLAGTSTPSVTLQADGSFTAPLTFQNGLNTFTITAVDNSGNRLVKTQTYTFDDPDLVSRQGTYTGLVKPVGTPSPAKSAAITATVSASSAVSGTFRVGTRVVPFTGTLDSNGVVYFAPNNSARKTVDATSEFSLTIGVGAAQAELYISNTLAGTATLLPSGAPNPALTSSADSTKFTLVFRPSTPAGAPSITTYPQGYSFATLTVSGSGAVSAMVTLADGTPTFTATGALSQPDAEFGFQVATLYSGLYNGLGSLALELVFTPSNSLAQAEIELAPSLWFRPAINGSVYSAGWSMGLALEGVGAKFVAQEGISILPSLPAGSSNAAFNFSDGQLSDNLNRTADVSATDVVTNRSTDTGFAATISRANGSFTGTFTHANNKKTTFKGVVVQKGESRVGAGFFLSVPATTGGTSESGRVFLSPHR